MQFQLDVCGKFFNDILYGCIWNQYECGGDFDVIFPVLGCHHGRNADALYYFTYVEGNQALFSTYSLCIIIPSIIGAACFPPLFRLTNNKGRSASIFALLTGISMFCMYFFSVGSTPIPFYVFSCLAQFFFSGFNTAIYAIIPDCVEYGEWKTGLRNDGFQYAFISLGNKVGMAIGTSVLAVMKHSFTTIPGKHIIR